ncbi:MAG: transketolase [Deltaproteobacteria bacterium]|nr:transketolase [Deltaproteobacteria bacterium]
MKTADLDPKLRERCVQTIQMLAVDAVEKAKSGHPGAPMGLAELAFTLWTDALRFDPRDPAWIGRDRFILSNGHASMLLYSLLHAFGYALTLDDLRAFRQLGSKTPGHPENHLTPGVEVTTGPLGQGVGNAVGMAIAARMLSARFNTPDFAPFDTTIYGIAGDGDLMEGVASEAASYAGHARLSNLVFFYDDNKITIAGSTALTFSENVAKRFEAYEWWTTRIDGHSAADVARALSAARAQAAGVDGRPSLIIARTTIGRGSPGKANTAEAHGAPLGGDEARRTKEAIGWPLEPTFLVPDDVRAVFARVGEEKRVAAETWRAKYAEWRRRHAALAEALDAHLERKVPEDIEARLAEGVAGAALATRQHSQKVIQRAAAAVPALVGGSADLEPSTLTLIDGGGSFGVRDGQSGNLSATTGRNIHFGIREHAMGAIVNGIALHGGFIPFGATFLQFADYMRPAIRLAALSHAHSVFVFTHDSIFLGEDGPTHQPVEHLAALRAIPGVTLFRPADGLETAMAWAFALRRTDGPTVLCLTRQKLPALERPASFERADVLRGAYTVFENEACATTKDAAPRVVLVATGSEVALTIDTAKRLTDIGVRVVSMPSVELFDAQPAAYREALIPRASCVAVVEAGRSVGWHRIMGRDGLHVGVETFGQSAPAESLARAFGFIPEAVSDKVRHWLRSL